MTNHEIYQHLELSVERKKVRLSKLKQKLEDIENEVSELEIRISDDSNGLVMIFDLLIAS